MLVASKLPSNNAWRKQSWYVRTDRCGRRSGTFLQCFRPECVQTKGRKSQAKLERVRNGQSLEACRSGIYKCFHLDPLIDHGQTWDVWGPL